MEYYIVSPGCSGRVGNKRLITDLLGRIRFIRLPYVLYSTIHSTVLSTVREEGGATEVDAIVQIINWNICKGVVVAMLSSCWGSPS